MSKQMRKLLLGAAERIGANIMGKRMFEQGGRSPSGLLPRM
jgi:hypothetical protein